MLKAVALISGGKDSLFSILHCTANGHHVVALANLYPTEADRRSGEDLDSFMYQTVGHSVVPLYGKALGLPLYRRSLTGKAANANKNYSFEAAKADTETVDEVEDLFYLLQEVKLAHPDITAVSTGAILSDYQRTRVESVAVRLGLVPLSFLWQYPFLPPYDGLSLLKDMASVGQDSRIIKVASGGLDEGFLWRNVASSTTQTRLLASMNRFGPAEGGAVLGEGGEYETLTLDGPLPLWQGRIHVEEQDLCVSPGEAGAATILVNGAHVAPHSSYGDGTPGTQHSQPRVPPLFDDKFATIKATVIERQPAVSIPYQEDLGSGKFQFSVDDVPTWQRHDTLSGSMYANATGAGDTAAAQTRNIMLRLTKTEAVHPDRIASTTILLRSMSDFAAVNAGYGSCFDKPLPPTRVTVSCGKSLPQGVLVVMSFVTSSRDSPKEGLHVQSRSYWAPANIGPYSQAICCPLALQQSSGETSLVHVAGQIPLLPATMELPSLHASIEASAIEQAVLSLQHLWRIGQIMQVQVWLGAICFIGSESSVSSESQATIASQVWTLAHERTMDSETSDDEATDAWDIMQRSYSSHYSRGNVHAATKPQRRPEPMLDFVPPLFVAQVAQLPRTAMYEWYSTGMHDPTQALECKGKSKTPTVVKDVWTDWLRRDTAWAFPDASNPHVIRIGTLPCSRLDLCRGDTTPLVRGAQTIESH